MKTIVKSSLLIFTAITLILAGCTSSTITPSKVRIARKYTVGNFQGIESDIVAIITYKQAIGNSTVEIQGPDNLVELIEVEVNEGILKLSTRNNSRTVKDSKITVNISSPTISSLTMNGIGNIKMSGPINTDELKIAVRGVGDIEADELVCSQLKIISEGVGNIDLKGVAEKLTCIAKGVGNIHTEDLETKNIEVHSDGVGNVYCYATQSININLQGVGNVNYKGQPEHKIITKTGVGKIKTIN